MKNFLNEEFLLENETAKELYHKYAENMPLFDYHCHLPVKEIYENKAFDNIGEMWLAHDHYKWRMMRCCGIPEEFITGNASWHDKYIAFSKSLPQGIGNPIYHWTHLELKRYFGIDSILNPSTAEEIWNKSNDFLASKQCTPQYFISKSNVDTLCTCDDPADTLEYHLLLKKSSFNVNVIPAFRPDKAMKINESGYEEYLGRLSKASGIQIIDYETLAQALEKRIEDFNNVGCFSSDHDMNIVFCNFGSPEQAEAIFRKRINGESLTDEEISMFKATLIRRLCRSYYRYNWAMELHIGCDRSVNELGVQRVGRSSGYDSPGDSQIAAPLGHFLSVLNTERILPKTVLFCLNPKDNWVIASLATTFQESNLHSKIQFGTAWWMQDHIPGMLSQMEALASTGVFGHFIGMLTDSRSYLSYTRFEYFRRILCNYIASFVEKGMYPADMEYLGEMVQNICFTNAKKWFASKNS